MLDHQQFNIFNIRNFSIIIKSYRMNRIEEIRNKSQCCIIICVQQYSKLSNFYQSTHILLINNYFTVVN